MKEILIYSDVGVGPLSFQETFFGLQEELDPSQYLVRAVSSKYFTTNDWEEKTALLVFPGGRDMPYHHYLRGSGNARIAEFVASGGSYLGICAGGYYGSAAIEFEKGGELEVVEGRELAFFPGKAVGPAYGKRLFCYQSEKGAKLARVRWGDVVTSLYYNGGCFFDRPDQYASVEVLATYEELNKAAIVLCSIGKGKAILSGVHPERSLSSHDDRRRAFWQKLLKVLLS